MTIEPQRNFVLVELRDDTPRSASGIEIVRAHKTPSYRAHVLAVGPDVREVVVGSDVIVSRLQGIEIEDKLLLPESAVLATL